MDGSPLKVYGSAWVELQIGQTVHTIMAIFADITIPAMLGMDWWMELCVNGRRIKCTGSMGESFVGRVVVAKDTEISAGHEVIVAGAIVGQSKGLTGPLI